MDGPDSHLDAVIDVFSRLGVTVRRERLGGGGGGLCTLHGKQVLFVDLDADAATRLDQSILALSTVPGLDTVYVVPAVRERIERIRSSPP